MNKNPVYIVDDDNDEEEMTKEAFIELGIENEVKFFTNAESVLQKLKNDPVVPFLIISDVNLPGIDGFELREKILKENPMRHKSVPFIFWSTKPSEAQIKRAYDLSAHGFFLKGRTYGEIKAKIQEMITYWSDSLTPSP